MRLCDEEIRDLYKKQDEKIEGMIEWVVKMKLKEPLESLEVMNTAV